MSSKAAGAGAGNEDKQALETATAVLDTWRRAIEAKDWNGLSDLVGLPQIFISGKPQATANVVQKLEAMTSELFDFDVGIGELTPEVISADRVNLAFALTVLWTDKRNFEEQHLAVTGHAGFIYDRAAWRPAYLMLSNAAEPAPKPVESPPAAAPISDEAIAAAAARYFQQHAEPAAPPGAPNDPPQRPRRHLVYVPVVIDEDLARDLLGKH